MEPLEVGSFEAKNRLSELLALAEKGQKIFITRRGKRIAMLTSAQENERISSTELLDLLRSFRQAARRGPESLKELIDEGRH